MTKLIPRSQLPPAPRRPLDFYRPLVDALNNFFEPTVRSGSAFDPVYELPQMRPPATVILGGQSKPAPKKVAEPQAKGKPRGGAMKSALGAKKTGFRAILAKLSAKAQGSPLLQKRSSEEEEESGFLQLPSQPSMVVSGASFGAHPKPS